MSGGTHNFKSLTASMGLFADDDLGDDQHPISISSRLYFHTNNNFFGLSWERT